MKILIILLLSCVILCSQEYKKVFKDIVYMTVGERELKLDLYMPVNEDKPFLIIWIHGGAWRAGSKEDMPLNFLNYGFATASVEYRLSTEAQFPALIHDIKAAIRYLRANAEIYGYQNEKITIAGSSAGGHLAALVGTTNNDKVLEGTLGEFTQYSSSVQAVIDYFGPTNFNTILQQSTPHGLNVREPALNLLLGDQPQNLKEKSTLASPVYHVDKDDPPIYILHGDQDPQVPINQSHELYARYIALGLMAEFEVLDGAAHGGDMFFDDDRMKKVTNFLDDVLEREYFSKDSKRQPGVPKGTVTKHIWKSRIFANTVRDYYIYVPAQYTAENAAALMVFQDGHAYVDEYGHQRAPIVFDNLIHQKKIPVIIALFIDPGHKSITKPENPWHNDNRRYEYDRLTDDYARFLLEELIPEVKKKYNISNDRKLHAIAGQSSGAICAFTAAWQRPDFFHKVLSEIGSFTNIEGGHNYPSWIRKKEKHDIRIFLQDGRNDLDNEHGNWWLANLQMKAALEYKGYDYKFVADNGKHSGLRGGQILPQSLIWLWQDIQEIEKE